MYDSATGMNFLSPGERPQHSAFVVFFLDAVYNGAKSEELGRAVYDEVEKVRIIIPGDKNSEVVCQVEPRHRQEYAQQYAAFKAGQEVAPVGTPLETWPPMTPAMVANYKALNIHTVEQLAEVTDGNLQNLGLGARKFRDQAALWIEQASGAEPMARLQSQLNQLQADRDVDRGTIADLKAALDAANRRIQPQAAE